MGAPQRWFSARYEDEDVAEFRQLAAALDIGPNVVHAPYLVNLASPDTRLRDRSIHALVNQLHWCERLGVLGLVVHVGSARDASSHAAALDLVIDAVGQVLNRSNTSWLLMENTAGMGASIGSDFADLGAIIERLGGDHRLRVCLDTAHTFEAGHDIRTRDGLDMVLERFDRQVGLDRLAVVHANDSKTPFGSRVDRHENVGQGHLGATALGHFMTHPAVQHLPFYLEVPGLRGHGPDRENVATLRRLAGLPPLPPTPVETVVDEEGEIVR